MRGGGAGNRCLVGQRSLAVVTHRIRECDAAAAGGLIQRGRPTKKWGGAKKIDGGAPGAWITGCTDGE